MVILSQTTLQNSGNKSAHYLKHLLRDMFHTVWGHAPGNNRSAWGLGSWKEATLLHYLFLRLYVFLSLMDHFDWGRLEVNIWDAPMFKLFRNLPLTGIRISLLIYTPWTFLWLASEFLFWSILHDKLQKTTTQHPNCKGEDPSKTLTHRERGHTQNYKEYSSLSASSFLLTLYLK